MGECGNKTFSSIFGKEISLSEEKIIIFNVTF